MAYAEIAISSPFRVESMESLVGDVIPRFFRRPCLRESAVKPVMMTYSLCFYCTFADMPIPFFLVLRL